MLSTLLSSHWTILSKCSTGLMAVITAITVITWRAQAVMALGEVLPMIHPTTVIPATMVITKLKPLTSLEELSIHIQNPAAGSIKQWWNIHPISIRLTLSVITCATPHTCILELK